MSPVEVRLARGIEEETGFSRSRVVQPGRTERVSPAHFGIDYDIGGERAYLEISCDPSDDKGEVVVFREKSKPRFELGPINFGFKVHDVQKTQYKLRKGAGKKYIKERGRKVFRLQMR